LRGGFGAADGCDDAAAPDVVFAEGGGGGGQPVVADVGVSAAGFAAGAGAAAIGIGLANAAVVAAMAAGFTGEAAAGNDTTAGVVCTDVAVGDDVIPSTGRHNASSSTIAMARSKLMSTSPVIGVTCARRAAARDVAAGGSRRAGPKLRCVVGICRQRV
jgi:hypothetical protein